MSAPSKSVTIRMDRADYERLEQVAQSIGVNVSEALREGAGLFCSTYSEGLKSLGKKNPDLEHYRDYLLTLPAVESLGGSNIKWSPSFKREFVERTQRGESPTAVFRSRGLPPQIIGEGRIANAARTWPMEVVA